MRRSRFAQSDRSERLRQRARRSRDALSFDVARPRKQRRRDARRVARRRLDLRTALLLVGAPHLADHLRLHACSRQRCSSASAADNPLDPVVAGRSTLDCRRSCCSAARSASDSRRTPSSRLLCVYLAADRRSCGLGSARPSRTMRSQRRLRLRHDRDGAGIFDAARSSSITSPPLALVNAHRRHRRRRLVLAQSPLIPVGVDDAVAGAGRLQHRRHAQDHRHRPRAAAARVRRRARRCISSTSSRTAAAAGSGRPTRSAPCPMSRGSSPTISNASPSELLGRQFTDLLSVDTDAPDSIGGAQDAGLPSVGALPLLRRRRPPGERAGRPLVAVGQPDLRRARPLPRLPRHRHRPHRAAPVRARDLAPRAVQFADRPAQPRDDAPDARRGAAQRRPSPEGLRLVHDRSRPVQERQRHARPPDRRRAAAPGRRAADVGDGQPRPGRPPRRRRVPGGAARARSTSACSNRSPAR